uniref:Uncharacterized protein n=1 Tax=Anguilla anguilla TaxID=7936 RepID=A0A0E9S058_ANGAN
MADDLASQCPHALKDCLPSLVPTAGGN